ncbi:ABC transporter substrate-binding protein [Costertonia aggregata]|uniref:ABC transporter substrate-binding protein n=1 Tax=Costertonia aggregata TaxID=343403 RepID=UPI00293BEF9F|nr:ABC transporter substrate-binding protein [Costertonia aggregata]
MKKITLLFLSLIWFCCKEKKEESLPFENTVDKVSIEYAKGFSIEKQANGLTTLKISSPWPNAKDRFTYALVPKEKMAFINLNKNEYDAIVTVPVEKVIVTSTTHIPALEALNVLDKLVGFPNTKFISSKAARKKINEGKLIEIGNNESINTEMVLSLSPEVVIGFGINAQNKAYETIQRSNIPVVYNGDWTEQTPLGKAEWIKFFAPFFEKEKEAEVIFEKIEASYNSVKELAKKTKIKPSVMSGALYKDVWYLPGGDSWAAQFLKDANVNYLWGEAAGTGSLSLSWESVLQKAKEADFWIAPAQFITYDDMKKASQHYQQFDAFTQKKVYTFANTKGETGGILYYELGPQRPDLVLKDLIHILHPEILPQHTLFFFKPLE